MFDFHEMVIAKSNDMILKSKGVYSTDANGNIVPVGYHPQHYGEGIAEHHPFDIDYHNIDPMTGQYGTLTHHPHGMHGGHKPNGQGISGFNHPFGGDGKGNGRVLFPVEAVVKGIADFIQKKGYAQSLDGMPLIGNSQHNIPFSYHLAMEAVQEAIDMFNQSRPWHDQLPALFDENGTRPEWKQTVMGAFPKDENKELGENRIMDSSSMPIKDALGRLITFYLNSGTTKGEPERGPYPESGAVPFYRELKEVLNRRLGRGMAMDFVHNPYIEPHMMNPMMSRESSTEGQMGQRTMTPQQERELAAQSHYGAIAPEITIPHHPDAFFRIPLRGGRPSAKTVDMLMAENIELGLGLNEEQILQLARAPISALLTEGKKVGRDSAYAKTYDLLGQATGLHPGQAASKSKWARGRIGLPEELDKLYTEYAQDPTQWDMKPGEHSSMWSKHHNHARAYTGGGYGQGKVSSARKSLALFGGANEMGHDLNDVWNAHSGEPLHQGTTPHLQASRIRNIFEKIAQARIERNPDLQTLNPIDFTIGHPAEDMPTPQLPRDWRSVPSQAVLAAHQQVQAPPPPPPMPPEDPAQRSLFSFSDGLGEQEMRLLDAMETIQKKEASRNPEVLKMLPKRTLNRQNYDDLLLMASRFELTPQDIFSITEVRGDWENVAKALSVSPTVVSTVKVAFGGII